MGAIREICRDFENRSLFTPKMWGLDGKIMFIMLTGSEGAAENFILKQDKIKNHRSLLPLCEH